MYHSIQYSNIVGLDEAGRGCLAGPVVAAAVILPNSFDPNGITDSKKLSTKQRETLYTYIVDNAVDFAIEAVDVKIIDEINILNASILAMHQCLDALKHIPDTLLIDGNRFKKYRHYTHHCIIKGDLKVLSIGAASILAKVTRDRFMNDLHRIHPEYNWNKNKGYPTKEHKKAILQYGITDWHRKSFKLFPTQLSLDV